MGHNTDAPVHACDAVSHRMAKNHDLKRNFTMLQSPDLTAPYAIDAKTHRWRPYLTVTPLRLCTKHPSPPIITITPVNIGHTAGSSIFARIDIHSPHRIFSPWHVPCETFPSKAGHDRWMAGTLHSNHRCSGPIFLWGRKRVPSRPPEH